MAQLAEQLICNQQVIGSSPIIGFYGWIPEWPKGADCKSVASRFGGSNPPPSIIIFTIMVVFFQKLYIINNRVRISAGWSSLEARRAHNPKVAGSNPAPAIFLCNEKCTDKNIEVKNMLACFLTDIFLDVYGECRKRKTAGLELSHFGLKRCDKQTFNPHKTK